MTSEEDAAQVFGSDVLDSSGNKIGSVDNVWVDDATSELEFVAVKTGWFMGKTHIIPVSDAQISDGAIQVPFSEDQIKGAPSFDGDAELSPDQEEEIYSYYGTGRSTAASPSGLQSGQDTTSDYATGDTSGDTYTADNDTDQAVTLHEEELQAETRPVEAGRVRLRKVVRTEHQEVPVDLRREEVEIERVPATSDATDGTAFQEEEIEVPVMREEAVASTTTRATEQVRLNKSVTTDTENVGADVRREEVETDDDTSGVATGAASNYEGSNADSTGNSSY